MVSEANETGQKNLKLNNWHVFLLEKLNQLYVKGEMCDVTLKFNDGSSLQAHKLILRSCSSYFSNLPLLPGSISLKVQGNLKINHIKPIINFIYSGKLEFSPEDQPHILTAAKTLGIDVISQLVTAQKEPAKKKIAVDHKKYIEKKVGAKTPSASVSLPEPLAESTPTKPEPPPRPPGKRLPIWKNRNKVQIPEELYNSVHKQMKLPVAKRNPTAREEPRPTRFEWPEDGEEVPLDAQYEVTREITNDSCERISYESRVIVPRAHGPKPVVSETSIDRMPDTYVSVPPRAMKRARGPEVVQTPCEIEDDDYDDGHFETIHDFEDNSDDEGDSRSVIASKPSISSPSTPKPILKSQSSPSPSKKVRFSFSAAERETSEKGEARRSSSADVAPTRAPQPVLESARTPEQPKSHVSPAADSTTSSPSNGTASINPTKIINEILKKFPDLVKNNKNIKLRIKTSTVPPTNAVDKTILDEGKGEQRKVQYMVLKSDLANLKKGEKPEPISGPENRSGPWFCVSCANQHGPINFDTYYNYRKHLQEVHNERVDARICEYCGMKSSKRNLHLYHLYTKHGVPPPRNINFPKCDHCDYIALSESLLIKHRSNHTGLVNKEYICRVCNAAFKSNGALVGHMQTNLHRNISEQTAKRDYGCEYCGKIFNRNINLRAHIRTVHLEENRRTYEDEDVEVTTTQPVSLPPATELCSAEPTPLPLAPAPDPNDSNVLEVIEVPMYDQQAAGNKTLFVSQGVILAESPNAPLNPSSESEAMNNVATGIATSINIADRNVGGDVIVLDNPNELILHGTPASYVLNPDGGCYSVQEYIVPEIMSNSQMYTTALVSSGPSDGITYVEGNISIVATGPDHTYTTVNGLTTVVASSAPEVITTQAATTARPVIMQEPLIVSTVSGGDWVQATSGGQFEIISAASRPGTEAEIISASRPPAEAEIISASRPRAEAEIISASRPRAEPKNISAVRPRVQQAEIISASRPRVQAEIISGLRPRAETEIISASSRQTVEAEIISASRPRTEATVAPTGTAQKLVSDWGDLEDENGEETESEEQDNKPSRPTIELEVGTDVEM